ncbi:glutamate synthase-related protein [Anaerotruncus rubiinfantis]|uniref:glutamate synthase-related protein n=1 Tax=Anaerotruncus rubiinfantis TaxID=1720200 RepID=UPI00083470CF|nr:glutamate synthase-related protein [Anaerotruncus rubiinfantis]
MAKYQCEICGFIYDEDEQGVKFDNLPEDWSCPACGVPKRMYKKIPEEPVAAAPAEPARQDNPLAYPKEFARLSDEHEPHMATIHTMAQTGQSVIEAMGTRLPVIGWDQILLLGAQLDPPPLDEHAPVNTRTVIGKHAEQPMVLETPVYVSHMSFGALSEEMKVALAKGSAMAKTAMCSGEGGILPPERDAAYKYIFEYVPNLYGVTDENLRRADAIEIKIGQGTKPGMGGHLPGEKVTEQIAALRGKPMGEDIVSPSRFERLKSKEDLRELVAELRERSGGRPIGVKIAAGRIERDMAFIAHAKPDFMTIDGRGGATGASPKLLKDAASVPTIFALHRARRYLDEHHLDIDLVITGGLRVSTDFAKALAMGADAVAIATASLMAAACQQYRICNTGTCPMGAATQDPELRKRLRVDIGAQRLANFLTASTEELKTLARCLGHDDVHSLSLEDLVTVNREIAEYTFVPHV